MSFVRPEVVAILVRWREVALAAAVNLWGLYWSLTGLGLIRWLGWALVLIGAVVLWAAVQRARFQAGHGGLGVVEIDERQVSYLAPVGGGILSIDALSEVSIGPDLAGYPVWRLRAGMEKMTIPASAEGTAAIFDMLAALPGANIEAAIRASRAKPDEPVVIWQRAA